MTGQAGPVGPLPSQFEDGLRLFAAALALKADPRGAPAAISTACGAIRCFLKVLEAAASRHVPDPDGTLLRLRDQCGALLTLRQEPGDALEHAFEAARLARDEAARLLVLMAVDHD